MSNRNRCTQCGSFKKGGECGNCKPGARKPGYFQRGKSTRMPLKGKPSQREPVARQ